MKHHSRVNHLAPPFKGPKPQRRDKKGSMGRRGCPPGSITESIGARNLTKLAKESKSLAVPAPRSRSRFRARGGYRRVTAR